MSILYIHISFLLRFVNAQEISLHPDVFVISLKVIFVFFILHFLCLFFHLFLLSLNQLNYSDFLKYFHCQQLNI